MEFFRAIFGKENLSKKFDRKDYFGMSLPELGLRGLCGWSVAAPGEEGQYHLLTETSRVLIIEPGNASEADVKNAKREYQTLKEENGDDYRVIVYNDNNPQAEWNLGYIYLSDLKKSVSELRNEATGEMQSERRSSKVLAQRILKGDFSS